MINTIEQKKKKIKNQKKKIQIKHINNSVQLCIVQREREREREIN